MTELVSSGVLLDMDGVLYVGNRLVPGTQLALLELRRNKVPLRFITNTSTRRPDQLLEKLLNFGIEVRADEVFTAISATVQYLHGLGSPRCCLLLDETVQPCFAAFAQDHSNPDVVVVGDIGQRWNYALMNDIFNMLMRGAALVCVHHNKYWQTEEGLCIDIGAFIAGLEYASGQQAIVLGKPSRDFFMQGALSLGLEPAQIWVVGDDIDSDIGGAQAAGMRGVLVKTGKYREVLVAASSVRPDHVLDSIAAVPDLLGLDGRV